MSNPTQATNATWLLLSLHRDLKLALGDENLLAVPVAFAKVAESYAQLDAALDVLHKVARGIPPKATPSS
jgi:hypothetical protein